MKAAKKAEKDREREKERIKALLGGGNIRLIDLWDPEGKEESAAAIERANRRRRLASASAESKSTYPTPPSSTDGDREVPSIPPVLNSFAYCYPPPPTIASRWSSLTNQIERFRLAKERAAKAREEESARRKEKEKELDAQARAEADATAVKKAPPPPASGKRSSAAAVRPPVESTSSPTALNDRSPNVPILSPTTYTTEPPSAIPPSTRKPVKKGKKKRSAHANALNVHHRDNYVPSRIPSSHHASTSHHDGPPPLTSWPASEEAIAAAGGSRPSTSYFAGPDEWLCAFCEYDLFYGDPASATKAIRRRKQVLKVRSKARRRAAGTSAPAPLVAPEEEES